MPQNFKLIKHQNWLQKNSPAYWDTSKEKTTSQFELFKKYDGFEDKDYIKLHDHCHKIGIDFLSTPFDDEAADFIAKLVPFFKIASADINNIPLLRKLASHKKPIILSTGASTVEEIKFAVNLLEENGVQEIGLLHCILNYPTKDENASLGMIHGLKKDFPDYILGYSDHTMPHDSITSLVVAHLFGATILEKHFTNDKTLPGNDHYHAMDVTDLKSFQKKIDDIYILAGNTIDKNFISGEEISRLNARRSIVLNNDLSKGEILTTKDITYKRPGTGITTNHWDDVIGKKINKNLEEDHILEWDDLH
jgi:N-acetylneuraminate synthase